MSILAKICLTVLILWIIMSFVMLFTIEDMNEAWHTMLRIAWLAVTIIGYILAIAVVWIS